MVSKEDEGRKSRRKTCESGYAIEGFYIYSCYIGI